MNNLRFEKIPKRALKNCSFAQVDSVILIRSAKGTLYTNCGLGRNAHYGSGLWGFTYAITECLDQLGMLSKEDKVEIDKYYDHLEKIEAANNLLRRAANLRKPDSDDKVDGISYRIDQKKVEKAWYFLDWYDQRNAQKHGYQPIGTTMKPEPKRDI
jgi:hypothetical protein